MVNEYRTVYEAGRGEVVEKKSRFIADVVHVESEEEALAFIESIRKKYWDARHHCFAYSIGTERPILRFSDDGEPSGTAGKPILEVLTGEGLCNSLIIVTRYFGGTLLGTGGLVRAYTASAQEGVRDAIIADKKLAGRLLVTCDYTWVGKLQYMAAQSGYETLSSDYSDVVRTELLVPVEEIGSFTKKLAEATGGQVVPEDLGRIYYAVPEGICVTFET